MKLFLVGILIFTSTILAAQPPCNSIKYDLKVVHTTSNLNNGEINITITKSSSKVKAYLYGDEKSKNRLDVEIDELINLAAGKYFLVLQDKKCSTIKRDIVVK